MDALVLTLGHNSSAILIHNGEIICGYENERLSLKKSDSTFPRLAIEEILKRYPLAPDIEIMVGHWALDGDVNSMLPKHWDPTYIKEKFPYSKIQSLNAKDFTHHDSHAYSALAFVDSAPFPRDETFILVMDGFGTLGENLSIYKVYDKVPVLQQRKFGFGLSMGLFYQYTTAYLQMKQNQDEYKLLAFEAHIEDAKPYIIGSRLDTVIRKWSEYFCDQFNKFDTDAVTDPLISIGALPQYAKRVSDIHDSVLEELGYNGDDLRIKRIIIAYFTQAVVEEYVRYVITSFHPTNLILTGGLFYNVKLNSMISRMIKGKLSIMPLAGDQGAGIGIYHAKYGLRWPDHLYWGDRNLEDIPDYLPPGIITFRHDGEMLDYASEVIARQGFVNIVRGAMEFGPRALCHTSTLGMANNPGTSYINELNKRTNEMPFAPAITPNKVKTVFQDTEKIHLSLDYMIVTRDYNDPHSYMQAAHLDVNRGVYTGRPQISRDPGINRVLNKFGGVLINTSYNYHGVPIVYDWTSIIHTHKAQLENVTQSTPYTLILTGEIE